jgi:flavin-dependent dehydrogenase
MEKAKQSGVEVLEQTQVIGLLFENGGVSGVKVKSKDGQIQEIATDLTIDATGRANVLGKLAAKSKIQNSKFKIQNSKSRKSKIQNPKSKIVLLDSRRISKMSVWKKIAARFIFFAAVTAV